MWISGCRGLYLMKRQGVEGADRKSKDSNSRLWSRFYLRRISRLLCGALGGRRMGWGRGGSCGIQGYKGRSLAALDLS